MAAANSFVNHSASCSRRHEELGFSSAPLPRLKLSSSSWTCMSNRHFDNEVVAWLTAPTTSAGAKSPSLPLSCCGSAKFARDVVDTQVGAEYPELTPGSISPVWCLHCSDTSPKLFCFGSFSFKITVPNSFQNVIPLARLHCMHTPFWDAADGCDRGCTTTRTRRGGVVVTSKLKCFVRHGFYACLSSCGHSRLEAESLGELRSSQPGPVQSVPRSCRLGWSGKV